MKKIALYLFFLVFSLFLGCSKKHDVQSFNAGQEFYDDFKKAIEKTIKDEDKQKKAVEVLDSFKDEIVNFDKYLDDFLDTNKDVILDYNSTKEDLLKVTESLDKERAAYYEKMLDLHTQLVELTTEEEWETLIKKLKSNMFNY